MRSRSTRGQGLLSKSGILFLFYLYCQLDEEDDGHAHITPEPHKLNQLAQAIQAKFKLDLFGVDVIIENGTGRYAVIDINAFPGKKLHGVKYICYHKL